jgi:hypothetical protein
VHSKDPTLSIMDITEDVTDGLDEVVVSEKNAPPGKESARLRRPVSEFGFSDGVSGDEALGDAISVDTEEDSSERDDALINEINKAADEEEL